MRKLFSILVLACGAVAHGQPAADSYASGLARAIAEKKPLVVFVGVKVRPVYGAITVGVNQLDGTKSAVIVSTDGKKGVWLAANATDEQIAARTGVKPPAIPFVQPTQVQPTARPEGPRPAVPSSVEEDNGPWLPAREVANIRAGWPKSIPFSAGLRFYRLTPLYQKLYTMSSVPYNDPTHLDNDVDPDLFVSGGMRGIHRGWMSVKGLDLPKASKIKVWKEATDVRAFALTPRWRWEFPVGTVAYDVLLGENNWPFEIRTQTKTADGWESKVLFKNKAEAPAGYSGAGMACASCHGKAALVRDVPGQIYRHVTWGDDGRFSWRPFTENGRLDERWPLQISGAKQQINIEENEFPYIQRSPSQFGRFRRR